MKCPKCGYEDLIFELPANVYCPICDFQYQYPEEKIIAIQRKQNDRKLVD